MDGEHSESFFDYDYQKQQESQYTYCDVKIQWWCWFRTNGANRTDRARHCRRRCGYVTANRAWWYAKYRYGELIRRLPYIEIIETDKDATLLVV